MDWKPLPLLASDRYRSQQKGNVTSIYLCKLISVYRDAVIIKYEMEFVCDYERNNKMVDKKLR